MRNQQMRKISESKDLVYSVPSMRLSRIVSQYDNRVDETLGRTGQPGPVRTSE